MEPYKLRRWRRGSSPDRVALFSCARPGRSHGKNGSVPDAVVHKWIKGLPGGDATAVVSLLGEKPDGTSEFSFYSFAGAKDVESHRRRGPSFEQWLTKHHADRNIVLAEHPTTDFRPIEDEALEAIGRDIERLLNAEKTVVVVDSGGETRTGVVLRKLGFVEDPRA